MKDTISFDFEVGESAVKELEATAALIKTEYQRMISDDVYLLNAAWDSDSGKAFRAGYQKRAEELKRLERAIMAQADDIHGRCRRMYLMEQEAKRIASENEGK